MYVNGDNFLGLAAVCPQLCAPNKYFIFVADFICIRIDFFPIRPIERRLYYHRACGFSE